MAEYTTPVNQFLKSIDLQPYDRYLPNAFNDSLSLLEKVNKVIYQLNESNQLTNEVVEKWNTFVDWVNTDGIDGTVNNKINRLVTDGTFIELIDSELMVDFKNEINQKTNETVQKVTNDLINKANKNEVRLKNEEITQTDLSDELLRQMTGDTPINAEPPDLGVTNQKYALHSIGVQNVDFLKRGKNLFDVSKRITGKQLVVTNGSIIDNANTVLSDWIPVKPNTTYSISNNIGAFFYVFHQVNKTFISGNNINVSPSLHTITTPANCYLLRFHVGKWVLDSGVKIQLEEGVVNTPYEEYKPYVIDDRAVNFSAIDKTELKKATYEGLSLKQGKNLFNPSTTTIGKQITNVGGIADNLNTVLSDYIVVEPNEKYSITPNIGACFISYYTNGKTFSNQINFDTTTIFSFTTPSNVEWIRFHIGKTPYETKNIQLEKGSNPTEFQKHYPYSLDIDALNKEDIKTIAKSITGESSLSKSIMNTLGDSVTAMDSVSNFNGYQHFIKQKTGIPTIRNYGIGGTLIAVKPDDSNSSTAMCNRYTAMENLADINTVMGGLNDWSANIPFENENKYDKHTIAGAMRVLIEGLLVKYPLGRIVWLTCTPRLNINFADRLNEKGEQMNLNGNTIEDVANLQLQICREYNIPVIDVFHNVGWNRHNIGNFMSSNDQGGSGTPDNVHPNEIGHKRIGSLISAELEKLV